MEAGTSMPLIDIILGYLNADNNHSLTQQQKDTISWFLMERINGIINYASLYAQVSTIISNAQSLEKLEQILMMPDEPIVPTAYSHDENSKPGKKIRIWSFYEDQRLIAAIHRFGQNNWPRISAFVGNNRSRAQCAQRWNRGLNPRVSKEIWSQEEEKKLIALVESGETKGWTQVALGMGNRSDVQCRYHYIQMKREKKIPENNSEVDFIHKMHLGSLYDKIVGENCKKQQKLKSSSGSVSRRGSENLIFDEAKNTKELNPKVCQIASPVCIQNQVPSDPPKQETPVSEPAPTESTFKFSIVLPEIDPSIFMVC